jgi:prepilin signal peptidase PulO-like enzyme (type II secretory pathway)
MLSIIPLALIGLGVGILVNYLADVLPQTRRLSHPVCLYCNEPVSFLTFFPWPQSCPHCGKVNPRLVRHWVVDISMTFSGVWLWGAGPEELGYLLSFLVAAYFLLIVVVDVEHRLILIPTVFVGVALGFLAGYRMHGLVETLLGGLAGYVAMFLLYKFGELFARVVSRMRGETIDEVALGFGDVNLAGVLGLLLGWPVVLLGLMLAILVGGFAGLTLIVVNLILRRYKEFDAMPYAPYLILAAALIIFFPDPVRQFFLGFSPLLAVSL